MKHPSEEEIVLFQYGESRDPAVVERHLAACEQCRAAYDEIEATLAQLAVEPVPERGPDYGAAVWRRLRPRLEARPASSRWSWLLGPRRWAMAGAVAALMLAAFFTGRFWPRETPAGPQPIGPQVRERILLVAVGDHLERSQMVLLELVNMRGNGEVDIAVEQQRAEELVAANRIYRQAAVRSGEPGVASVLEELERVLLEVAHSPSRMPAAEFERLRARFEEEGILFKVRILDSQVRRKADRT